MSQTQLPYGPQWWWLSRSGVSDSCDPVDCSPPRPLPMGFFRQEHWSGVPFPSPGDLPDPGLTPTSPAFSSVQSSHSIMSNSLWRHGLKHARLPCLSPTPALAGRFFTTPALAARFFSIAPLGSPCCHGAITKWVIIGSWQLQHSISSFKGCCILLIELTLLKR